MTLRSLTLAAVLALGAGSVALATPTLDAAGKCRDNGKYVAQAMCKSAKPVAKTVCKDAAGKVAKCGTKGAKPVK